MIIEFIFQIWVRMTDNKTLDNSKRLNTPYPSHGGNPRAISKLSNTDAYIDFSASINPLSPPGCIAQLLLETPRLLREYPDPYCSIIKQRISHSNGVPEDWVLVSNGSTELIYLLPHLLTKGQQVAILAPCFSEYDNSFMAAGFTPHSVELSADNDFQINLAELFSQLDSFENLGAFIIGHPASPTGKLYDDWLPSLQEYCTRRNIVLVIDETFIDFTCASHSALNLLDQNANLILIRSLTKFYSIAGVRIGYGILHPEKIQQLNVHQYPWSVNALAQAIGAEVLLDKTFQEKTKNWIEKESAALYQALSLIDEIEVFSSQTNFFLFRIRDNRFNRDRDLYQYLLSQSLIIRNCGNFRGLDESFFRVSLRERLDNQKLVNAISCYFSSRQQNTKQ